jgi:DNA ligase-1
MNKANELIETSKNIKPMLAIEMEEKLVKLPAFVQPKLDGIRCIIYQSNPLSENNKIMFQSRQNKLFEPFLHILPDLEKIFKDQPDLILDGELYCHGLGFEAVTSMVRRAKTRHPDVEKINYVIYDCITNESNECYKIRMNKINIFLKHVFFIETIEVTKMSEIEDAHSHYTDYGYEGIMIRTNGLYKHGRSKDLLKYKKFKDSEYLVVGHTEGTGAHAGTAIFICQAENKTFNVVMNGPLEKRREMLKHVGDYYGKYLTVKYQELSVDGIPRFPIGLGFRVDL